MQHASRRAARAAARHGGRGGRRLRDACPSTPRRRPSGPSSAWPERPSLLAPRPRRPRRRAPTAPARAAFAAATSPALADSRGGGRLARPASHPPHRPARSPRNGNGQVAAPARSRGHRLRRELRVAGARALVLPQAAPGAQPREHELPDPAARGQPRGGHVHPHQGARGRAQAARRRVPAPTQRGHRRAAVLPRRPVHLRVARALALRRRHRHGLHRHRVLAAVAAAEFKKSGKLPHTNGKCLVCSRYVHTFIYKCARADPTFKPSASIPLQAFGNSLGVEAGENVPTHASVANDSDGYRPGGAALCGRAVGRHGARRAAAWPRCSGGRASSLIDALRVRQGPHRLAALLQRNVGAADESPMAHFCQPAGEERRPPLPATTSSDAADAARASPRRR